MFHLQGTIVREPTRYTIQLEAGRHVVSTRRLWRLVNHGCVPNIRIDTQEPTMIAIADIPAGEALRFNYNTTEWDMASPFECGCGFPNCTGWIRGFCHLNALQRAAIRPWLSPLLEGRFDQFD